MKVLIVISTILSAAMMVIWGKLFAGGDLPRLWRSFLIGYLFFTSIAAGMVTWPAIVTIAQGSWMGSLEKVCRLGMSFAIPSLLALLVLWTAAENWSPWWNYTGKKEWWLDNTFLFSRNFIAQLLFWFMAYRFSRSRSGKNNRTIAGWLILVYVLAFSLMGFDFIMALDPEWYSSMAGGYFFISALYTAAAAWALLSILLQQPRKDQLSDIGKLVIAFCMLTTYLLFSQLFPIWFENLPEEAAFLVPGMNLAWKPVSYLLLAVVYVGPVFLLMTEESKKNRLYMGGVSLLILAGMWIEKWWLVSAVFERDRIVFGWIELLPTIAFLGIMIAGMTWMLNRKKEEQWTNG